MTETGIVGAALGRERPLIARLRARVIQGAVAKGAKEEDARAALAEIESERPILDWLANGGLEKIVDLVLKLLSLL
jgi:hypothetical protein